MSLSYMADSLIMLALPVHLPRKIARSSGAWMSGPACSQPKTLITVMGGGH